MLARDTVCLCVMRGKVYIRLEVRPGVGTPDDNSMADLRANRFRLIGNGLKDHTPRLSTTCTGGRGRGRLRLERRWLGFSLLCLSRL